MTVRWTVRAGDDQSAQFALREPCTFHHFFCGFSSFGRAPPCQGGGGGFEPRNPLQNRRLRKQSSFSFWRDWGSHRVPLKLGFAGTLASIVVSCASEKGELRLDASKNKRKTVPTVAFYDRRHQNHAINLHGVVV